jgi:phosphonopyruvate decarboxylase
MIEAAEFINRAREFGFQLYSGVPCSYLKPLINYVIDSPEVQYIGAANEGDAVAIVSGAELAGKRGVVMFQNSGFGNAVNPLTSLNAIFRIPALVIVTWRGEPGGAADEPQHRLMGEITPNLFELLGIPWAFFPEQEEAIGPTLARAVNCMADSGLPYGLVMRKDSVKPYKLKTALPPVPPPSLTLPAPAWPAKRLAREEALGVVRAHVQSRDAVIATTGYTGRALYALADRANQFYMVGSMGCASSLGLGLAWAEPQRRVIVLDGDGAALMRLGALTAIGCQAPPNLVHILLDNELHESTGGQATAAHSVDLAAVAQACGYPRVVRAATPVELGQAIDQAGAGLTFIHVKTSPQGDQPLPRPKETPVALAGRFRAWLRENVKEG